MGEAMFGHKQRMGSRGAQSGGRRVEVHNALQVGGAIFFAGLVRITACIGDA